MLTKRALFSFLAASPAAAVCAASGLAADTAPVAAWIWGENREDLPTWLRERAEVEGADLIVNAGAERINAFPGDLILRWSDDSLHVLSRE